MGAESDPPLVEGVKMPPTPRFPTVRRGYDPDQVDAFMVAIATTMKDIQAKLRESRNATEEADAAPDGTTARMARFGDAGERHIREMLTHQRAEAQSIVAAAKAEADRLVGQAKRDAASSIDDARAFLDRVDEDARRISAETAARQRRTTEEIQAMQDRLLRIAGDLDRVLNPTEAEA